MNIKNAISALEQSQGEHLYDIYIPSLDRIIGFKTLKVGQLKTLNKFAIDDEDNFYKVLSALIVDLSNNEVDLTQINEIDRVLILSEIKKNNTTTPERIKLTCPECKHQYKHDLMIENYDNDDQLSHKIQLITKESKSNGLSLKYHVGLPSIDEQIKFKDYISSCKKKTMSKTRHSLAPDLTKDEKQEKLQDAVTSEEKFLKNNAMFLFLRSLEINGAVVADLINAPIIERLELFDQLPGNIKGEINSVISDNFSDIMDNFLKYKAVCPECQHEHREDVSISGFFII